MRPLACVLAFLAAPLAAVATPTIWARHLKAPPPCVRMNPPPTQKQTDIRFQAFAEAFVGKSKNITKAFEYIVADYIVRVGPIL